ncbi:hypothetical protein [Bartonella queenslandensis]|uniref:hypothetical protein n=1 Tax=Bartonella queenslandensis TaxID=481138 RepID=UPI0002F96A5E|nr:hypothetical protein [Bartonella queenslandensis]
MTATIAQFIRKNPPASLKAYFDNNPLPVAISVDWNTAKADLVKPLLKTVDELADTGRARLKIDAERLLEMTDEIGPQALMLLSLTRILMLFIF